MSTPETQGSGLRFAATLDRVGEYPKAGGYRLPDTVALMASNEGPEPLDPLVAEVVAEAASGINRYPDPGAAELRGALSGLTGVPPSQIGLGNGSCDLLIALGQAILEPGAHLAYAWPSFSVYPMLAQLTGAEETRVPLDGDEHDLGALLAAIRPETRLVIVCNPNNPTGTALPAEVIADFARAVPKDVCVLIDEAYVEFSDVCGPEELLPLVAELPNVVLLRTFSKAHGLCGLRVGYGLFGSVEPVEATDRIRQPFYLNHLAQTAAVAMLERPEILDRRVSSQVAARDQLAEGLSAAGFSVSQPEANFVWAQLPGVDGLPAADKTAAEAKLVADLREVGVLVRAGTALGEPGRLRISTGTPEEQARLLNAISK
ncbi:MAG: aminotransferase class I/II-fold pyridoxal phosphate-dependent enzyme [Solirubrobacteraceae bacterium]|nr:aminotransferase class I/II-fold pyridoxal phosphate-dependent enzyme [Solirubrobacteraceae bacterium]